MLLAFMMYLNFEPGSGSFCLIEAILKLLYVIIRPVKSHTISLSGLSGMLQSCTELGDMSVEILDVLLREFFSIEEFL